MFDKKYLIAFLSIVFISVIPGFVLGAGTNLIQNPTLTGTSGTPSGWLNTSWGNASSAVFSFPATTTPKIDVGNVAQVKITNYGTASGGGAAEWYFSPVTISPAGSSYTFSNEYLSTAPTSLIVQYTVPKTTTDCTPSHEGSSYFCYIDLQDLSATTGVWKTSSATFTAPSDVTAASVLQVLYSNGTLDVGNYSLTIQGSTPPPPPPPPTGQGVVSLSFDDGWNSQYVNALPILQAANMPATFYIISNAMLAGGTGANNILCNDPSLPYCDGATISSNTTSWTAADQYPDPSSRSYTFSESYTSSSTATLSVTYYNANGRAISGESNVVLATLSPTTTSKTMSVTFTIPTKVNINNASFSFTESVTSKNTLSVQNPSFVEASSTADTYMGVTQVKALQTAGEEIGLHTADHCDLVMLENNPNSAKIAGGPPAGACASALASAVTPTQEIQQAMQAYAANGLSPVDTAAYPYGSYDANIEALMKANGIIAARTVLAGYNTKNTDPFALYNQIIDVNATNAGIANVQSWIDTAVANKQWLILTFHNIEPANVLTANGDTDGTTPAFLQSIVNYLQTKKVPVMTVHQAFKSL